MKNKFQAGKIPIFDGGLKANIMPNHELVVLRTARRYRIVLERLFFITESKIRWILVPLLLLHHTTMILGGILLVVDATAAYSLLIPATLAQKQHCIVVPGCYMTLAVFWQKSRLLIEVAEEVNEALLIDQLPIANDLRAAVITDLENRHPLIVLYMTSISQVLISFYVLSPVVKFLTSTSPLRQLELPLNMQDPLSLVGLTTTDVTRVMIYFIFSTCLMATFFIIYLGKSLNLIILDSLKTAFSICGQSFETLGRDGPSNMEQFLSAVKLHQLVSDSADCCANLVGGD
nr:PREDICTED: uncharacterized protein LOC109031397 [Bemisia tabaci]